MLQCKSTELWLQDTWEGYLVAAAAGASVENVGTLAQQLLRKRYVGIAGSNKVVGALEVQQVSPAYHPASCGHMQSQDEQPTC